jgi:hypothetical protein
MLAQASEALRARLRYRPLRAYLLEYLALLQYGSDN